jgi:hexosaminidase
MNRQRLCVAMIGVVVALAACSQSQAPAAAQPRRVSPPVIPVPIDSFAGEGAFTFSLNTRIVYTSAAAKGAAEYFADSAHKMPGFKLGAQAGQAGTDAVSFAIDPKAGADVVGSYTVHVGANEIAVRAREESGLFYGAVTVWQLLTGSNQERTIPAVDINDAPRFQWRGLMLDSCRHYQSPEWIKKFIDVMAWHKLNVLHWHLTDDQAWRLEIKKYPKLTSVGAWRVPEGAAARKDIDPKTGKPRLYGGFYTQEQARDIVAYAAARHIKVVPEIEMPGHATAAIVAYPQLGVAPASNNLKEVPSDWGVYENLFNVDDGTFNFLEDVLTEVMDVFPSDYIHVGGDEAVKPQWDKSPKVQARMKALGVKDSHAMQGWFIQRMGKFIDSKGRKLIGWDEILEGGVPPNATVMSWRGIDGAIAAAQAGHDTVLSPAPDLYLDHWQSAGDASPGRSNTLSLEMVYKFNPFPKAITDDQKKRVLGVQANLWTELIRTDERVEYMAFPRTAALAEVAWSEPDRMGFADFQQRLEPQLRRYTTLGIASAREVATQPGATRRLSHDLDQCSDGYLLSLEDDAPLDGARAVFLVNISNPCWIWKGADLDKVRGLHVTVGQIPFNFQLGDDPTKIPLYKPRTASGELEIRYDNCDGPPAESVSLAPAEGNDALTLLPPIAISPRTGTHDLCFRFTRSKVDPIWAINMVELDRK